MLYELYERRVRKIVSIKNKIYKFRVLIITILAIIASLLTGFLATKGVIYDDDFKLSYVYGEQLQVQASAIFGSVEYEYRLEGTNIWTKEVPTTVGKYEVKATSKRSFGGKSEKVYKLEIGKKTTLVEIISDDKIDYGSALDINVDLVNGDIVSKYVIGFADLSKTATTAYVESITVLDKHGNDVTNSYKFDFGSKEIAFNAAKVKIKIIDKTHVYDAVTITSNDFELIESNLLNGHKIEITTTGKQTNVGETENLANTVKVWFNGIDVSANFDIEVLTGNLEVTKRPITIQLESDNKIYDGTPLKNGGFVVVDGTLVEGHEFKVLTSPSLIEVGTIPNSLDRSQYQIIDEEGHDVTGNYEITLLSGQLEVLQRKLIIETKGNEKVYDGTPLLEDGFKVSDDLLLNHEVTLEFSGIQTNAGSSDNTVSKTTIMHGLDDVTHNYDIEYVFGKLIVSKRSITIEVIDVTLTYDAQYHNSNAFKVIEEHALLDNDVIELTTSSYGQNVGSYVNDVTSITISNDSGDVTHNYDIYTRSGILTIVQRAVTIKPMDVYEMYDGTEKSTTFAIVVDESDESNIINGHTIEITTNTLTNVDRIISEITNVIIVDEDNTNVTLNYDITTHEGIIEVIPRPITITAESEERYYDGTLLSNSNFTYQYGEMDYYPFEDIFDFVVDIEGGLVDVGTANNKVLSVTILLNGIIVNDNFIVKTIDGILEVIPRPITITAESEERYYDGTLLSNSNFTYQYGEMDYYPFEDIFDFVVDIEGGLVDVGTANNKVLSVTILLNGIIVNDNFIVKTIDGILEVIPRPITIKPVDGSHIFDGDTHIVETYEYVDNSLTIVDGHVLIVRTDEVKYVGHYVINFASYHIVDSNHNDMTSNYAIETEEGSYVINPRPIVIITNSASKVYDGFELRETSYKYIIDETASTFNVLIDVFVTVTGTITNVEDHVPNTYDKDSLVIKDSNNLDITDNFIDVTNESDLGILKIMPRPIKIYTEGASKVYDGTELTYKYIELTDVYGGLMAYSISDIEIRATYTGSQTDVGTSLNTFENVELVYLDKDVTHNFDIEIIYGVLVVTPRPITVKLVDQMYTYNGAPKTLTEYIVLGEYGLVLDHEVNFSTDRLETNADEYVVNISTYEIIDSLGQSKTHNYAVELESGKLDIIQREIIIQTQAASKVYDGIILINHDYIYIDENTDALTYQPRFIVSFTGEQLNAGTSENIAIVVAIYNALDENTIDNYNINYVYEELEVIPRQIRVITGSAEKVYDGLPLVNNNWEVKGHSILEHHELIVEVTGYIVEIGRVFNTFNVQIIDKETNEDVTDFYIIELNEGILEVLSEPLIEIIIRSGTSTKQEDGLRLTNSEWSMEGSLALGHRLEVEVTGYIEEVGYIENSFNYAILDENNQDVTYLYDVDYRPGTLTIFGSEEIEIIPGLEVGFDHETNPDYSIKFKVFSSMNDFVYFRSVSYGDYVVGGTSIWAAASMYQNPSESFSPFEFPRIALDNSVTPNTVTVEAVNPYIGYLTPYYTTNGFLSNTTNDIYVNKAYAMSYELDYISYNHKITEGPTLGDTPFDAYEKDYREFVYNTYLQLPESTRQGLLEIAEAYQLNQSSPTIVKDIQDYIIQSGTYNYGHQVIPPNVDYVLHFLGVTKEGVCRHFAAAATAMYRAFGIPARYTTGYVTAVKAGNWVEVDGTRAHAWVEIYMDGYGWIPIEVTPGGVNGDGVMPDNNDPGQGSFEVGEGDDKPFIEVYSENKSKYFDGKPLISHDYVYYGDLLDGHELVVYFEGSQTYVGESYNSFTLEIIDSTGNDVTDQYRVRGIFGKLIVLPDNKKEIIEIQLFDLIKVYSASVVKPNSDDYYIIGDNLPKDYRIELDIIGELVDVGYTMLTIDTEAVRIYDEKNNDVTHRYNVVVYEGLLEVLKRDITITASSASKPFDGTPLVSNSFRISRGTLVVGHELDVTIIGSVTDIGSITNEITNVTILDHNNNDVTKNYRITNINGTLNVYP